MKVRIVVKLKEGVLDPQGQAVMKALSALGFKEVKDVRVGKVIDMKLEGDDERVVMERAVEMCRKFLANPVTEDFEILEVKKEG